MKNCPTTKMKFLLSSIFVLCLLTSEAAATNRHLGKKKDKKAKKAKKDKKEKKLGAETCPIEIKKPIEGPNVCAGSKIILEEIDCVIDGVIKALGQSGTDISVGYKGSLDTEGRMPVTQPYWMQGICPVNVHWHLGAEHRSEGQFDEDGTGPAASNLRGLAGGERLGFRCHHYDENDEKFTKEYNWQHCIDMKVGETYEVHWPHSLAGDCGTVNQYQTPFYDGVFCNAGRLDLSILEQHVGVQGQVFTVVNDEDYYFPDLMRGMIVDESLNMGVEITKYTGSTTGTSRNNEVCSQYAPITWQVDRKCHMVSASTFDKMCADMKMQRDDMSDDLYPHGSRELVADHLSSDNHVNRKLSNFVYH